MIEDHENQMEERKREFEGLYVNVKQEYRQLEQMREELTWQKSTQFRWFEHYSAHLASREREMVKFCKTVEAERYELRQLIQRFV